MKATQIHTDLHDLPQTAVNAVNDRLSKIFEKTVGELPKPPAKSTSYSGHSTSNYSTYDHSKPYKRSYKNKQPKEAELVFW